MVQAAADRPLVLVGLPAWEPAEALLCRARAFQRQMERLFPKEATILGIVPDRMSPAPESFPFSLVVADADSALLDIEIQGRFLHSRRLRR